MLFIIDMHSRKYKQFSSMQKKANRYQEFIVPSSLKLSQAEFTQRMHEHRINWHPYSESEESPPLIRVISLIQQGSVVNYLVHLGQFDVHIIMYNIQAKAPNKVNHGHGSFGQVRIQRSRDRTFIVKRQIFKCKPELEGWEAANIEEIQIVLIEIVIAKICSLFQIGPRIELQIGFDLLCYSNCIEFQMQLCQRASDELIIQSRVDLQEKLKLLHSIHIVHKDIKPGNIVYSPSLKKCVFIDFGLSQPGPQPIYNSKTCWEGTPGFISPDLMKLKYVEGYGYANLYQNDIYALNVSFQRCEQNRSESRKCHGSQCFKISSRIPELNSSSIAAFLELQGGSLSQKNLEAKNDQSQCLPQDFFSSTNYEFLKLIYKYVCFNEKLAQKDTRSSWKYLNKNELKQMFDIIESKSSQLVIHAISELSDSQITFESNNLQRFSKLKRSIYKICAPQLFYFCDQSETSLRNKIRIYGFSNQVLKLCRNIKLKNLKISETIAKYIEKINYPIQPYIVSKLLTKFHPSTVFRKSYISTRLVDYNSISSLSNLVENCTIMSLRSQKKLIKKIFQAQLDRYKNRQAASIVQNFFYFVFQLHSTGYNEESLTFKKLVQELRVLSQMGESYYHYLEDYFILLSHI